MNTILTFKATKANENKDVQYRVDLGRDILEGMTSEQVKAYATAHAKVELQNRKGGLIRASEDVDGARSTLEGFGYVDATVEVYVPTTAPKKALTPADIQKAIASGKLSKADVLAMLEA